MSSNPLTDSILNRLKKLEAVAFDDSIDPTKCEGCTTLKAKLRRTESNLEFEKDVAKRHLGVLQEVIDVIGKVM